MSSTVPFRICCFLIAVGLVLSTAAAAMPSPDRTADSTVVHQMSLKDRAVALWQGLARLLPDNGRKDGGTGPTVTYIMVPYPPYVIAVTSDGGGGVSWTPDG
jgi:hypothetical protein